MHLAIRERASERSEPSNGCEYIAVINFTKREKKAQRQIREAVDEEREPLSKGTFRER